MYFRFRQMYWPRSELMTVFYVRKYPYCPALLQGCRAPILGPEHLPVRFTKNTFVLSVPPHGR